MQECKFLVKWHGPYEVVEKNTPVNYKVQELKELLSRNRDVFSDQPGRTNVIAHEIITEPGKRVWLRPYRIPEARREAVCDEVTGDLDESAVRKGRSVRDGCLNQQPSGRGSSTDTGVKAL
ncbi:hypothetical protein SKAU_G00232020 [Synaphobranchus kaupii]|uniref:Uncharacterized protein n=1 Tax=Synaphobranchus kaupii TaxID=118154 RepID=A0A9Q1F697_SYNKA|nr:hypothetical protein SKAU_G00232020 [Synaphobranchus kaupii]